MKTFLAGLQNYTLQTSYSNNGNTTLLGRAVQKTINSQTVLGPTLTGWIDVFVQTGLYPIYSYYNPSTGHLFVLGATATTYTASIIYVALYTFNSSTGNPTYVGKSNILLPNAAATTPTFKGFHVYESGGNITPVITTTGSVAINGGKIICYNMTTSNFTVGGTIMYPASSSSQAGGVYFLQDPSAYGSAHIATTAFGSALPQFSSSGSVNTKSWMLIGAIATPVMYSWDLSVAPVVAGTVTNGVNSLSGGYSSATYGVSTLCYLSMSAQNGYATGAGVDPIVLLTGTASVPTGLTAWVTNTAQSASNVYFTRDVQVVNTFTVTSLGSGITSGATYTSGGVTFTAYVTYSSGATSILLSTTNAAATSIAASGTLTLASGTGPASITYSAYTSEWYFNLSATSGGAAVAVTQTESGFTMMRAFGTCVSNFSLKTGTLPALSGGTQLTNAMGYCKPISAPANSALNGADCIYILTTTGLYIGKISDLTTLTTTWPSMITGAGVNISGTGTDYVAETVALGTYAAHGLTGDVDRFFYTTNASSFVCKPYQNSVITDVFGNVENMYYEGNNPTTVKCGLAAIIGMNTIGGWLFLTSQTVGQRGILYMDLYSDSNFGNTGVISPVYSCVAGTSLQFINDTCQLYSQTDDGNWWIRSATTSTSSTFSSGTLPVGSPATIGTASNGWTSIQKGLNNSAVSIGPYFQLCFTYNSLTIQWGSPFQLYDGEISWYPPGESSDSWAFNVDNTTQGLGSPSYACWYLQQTYASTVPTLYARVYDINGNLIFNQNTSSNPTSFQYSTNGGTSWTSLGTIPNTVGTLVRVLVTPTPSITGFASLRES